VSSHRIKILAAIAISPFVNSIDRFIGQTLRRHRRPVLSVTSDVDGDPLRIVADPRQRSIPFDQMNGPDKYFLSLYGGHALEPERHPDQSGHGSSSGKSARTVRRKRAARAADNAAEAADQKLRGSCRIGAEIARAPKTVLPRIHFLRGTRRRESWSLRRDHRILGCLRERRFARARMAIDRSDTRARGSGELRRK